MLPARKEVSQSVDDAVIVSLKNSLYPGAKDESIRMVISYCKAAGLDPMQKPVHIVPMWNDKIKALQDIVMPGIGFYRIQASRTGEYGGITEPEFGPSITKKLGHSELTFPEWCKITVRRMVKGEICDFTVKEFWLENYAVDKKNNGPDGPNSMWKKRPYGQLAKCVEAQALRKAFPEIGSQPTGEEMEGKPLEVNGTQDNKMKEVEEVPFSDYLTIEQIKRLSDLLQESKVEEYIFMEKMCEKLKVQAEFLDDFHQEHFPILESMLLKKIENNAKEEVENKRNLLNAG